ncbi:tRNA (adenosine(37)-N6)-threonylcarbamoyltransferase complex dimerization subunit type 1 TsaB [Aurantibacter crassamenti]|uniref:tRNA (adenosine(37)-N6)-threonylcarbamoyltransferase complex dimerization subunit type 1 TsaB n=1 Tax=Aurantibacter crassamenti TaxID=1837375 RepID=UPI0019393D6D|nr:tRNA (adenosine(37)-N6)-threonylcarbamoyltransferase complex dimerization subunit type 1 TsaB [Aurantibacter crassamenti]MBM1106011.1 tRNA (adenosine(37)-N6)-threonylcarbamoyltransferase complex dimerization subunit type 1 TsaB [Aurantibacter crassamenti]
MATILNIETATTNCSVSIAKDGKLLSIKEQNTPNYSHSEQLHVFIDTVIKEAKLSFDDVDAIAVSKGPGSYTGLRIGVSAAKGLCFSLDIPLISIPTLESMAHQCKIDDYDFIIPLLDARRMEVYAEVYDNNLKLLRETKAEIIDVDSFNSYAAQGKVLLAGSGAQKCQDILTNSNFEYKLDAVPSAKHMCPLSHLKFVNSEFEDVAYFEPFYLKDFIVMKPKS